jgi:NAD-dependent SIR2 family protein deacetylase
MINDALTKAADLIFHAGGLIIAAGAGMGVDSGLSEFRGEGGFWKRYPALGLAGLSFTSIVCPDAFRSRSTLASSVVFARECRFADQTLGTGCEPRLEWFRKGISLPCNYP